MAADRVDVVVIGSGAAGAAAHVAARPARRLGRLPRAGRLAAAGRLRVGAARLRGVAAPRPDTLFPNDRKRPEDYPVTTAGDGPTNIVMWNGVGGSTVHWEGHFPRFHPSDFRVRPLDGVAEDWPIRYDDLEPLLRPQRPPSSASPAWPAIPPTRRARARQTPPLPLGRSGEALVRGFEKLGWHWWPSDNAILSRDYDGRKGCDYRGRCNFGCPLQRQSLRRRHLLAEGDSKAGAELTTWARVKEITVGGDGRVTGVRLFRSHEASCKSSAARVVVVCCNGIGTPRLLLASTLAALSRRPRRTRAATWAGTSWTIRAATSRASSTSRSRPRRSPGIPSSASSSTRPTAAAGFVRGYSLMVYRPVRAGQRRLGRRGAGPVGRRPPREMRGRLGHSVGIAVMAEDLPEDVNRVDARSRGDGLERHPGAARDLRRRRTLGGCSRTAPPPRARCWRPRARSRILDAGASTNFAHYMGTARMGRDPRHVGGERLEPGPRRAEPVRRGRQLVHDLRGREPHLHDRRAGPARRGGNLDTAQGVGVASLALVAIVGNPCQAMAIRAFQAALVISQDRTSLGPSKRAPRVRRGSRGRGDPETS